MRYLDWTLFLRIGRIIHTGCLCDWYSRLLRGFSFSISLLTISLQFLLLLIRNFSEAIFYQQERRSVRFTLFSRVFIFKVGIWITFLLKYNLIFAMRIALRAVTTYPQILLNFYLLLSHVVLINSLTPWWHMWKIFHRLHYIAMSSRLRLLLLDLFGFHRAVANLLQHIWLAWLQWSTCTTILRADLRELKLLYSRFQRHVSRRNYLLNALLFHDQNIVV